jgi:Ca2+/H+ antiporter
VCVVVDRQIILFTMAVITAMPVLITGSSNWLHGSLLITCYGFIGFALWHEEGTVEEAEGNKLKRMLMGVEL